MLASLIRDINFDLYAISPQTIPLFLPSDPPRLVPFSLIIALPLFEFRFAPILLVNLGTCRGIVNPQIVNLEFIRRLYTSIGCVRLWFWFWL